MPIFYTDSGSFGDVTISGSTIISASSGIPLQIIGSGSTLFSISGSSGEMFRISDSGSSTSIFSVSSGSTTILDINSSKVVSISGSLVVTGSITGTTNTATNLTITDDTTTNATNYLVFVNSNTGTPVPRVDSSTLTYNPNTNTVTATTFAGNASTATTATNANNVAISSTNTNSTYYPHFGNLTTGNDNVEIDINLTYNPSTNTLTTTTFVGALTGTASWASRAITASYITSSFFTGTNAASSASFATTASYVTGSIYTAGNLARSASYAITASYALSSPGGGGGTTFAAGNTDNRVVTATGASPGELNGEAGLTFDGSTLVVSGSGAQITGSLNVTGSITYTGNLTAKGINTEVQYNDNGVLAGASKLTYNNATSVTTSDKMYVSAELSLVRRLYIQQYTVITNSTYTAGSNDLLLLVDTTGNVDIDLTNIQEDGRYIIVKDATGQASGQNITFTGASIDSGIFTKIDVNWGAVHLVYNSNLSYWLVVANY